MILKNIVNINRIQLISLISSFVFENQFYKIVGIASSVKELGLFQGFSLALLVIFGIFHIISFLINGALKLVDSIQFIKSSSRPLPSRGDDPNIHLKLNQTNRNYSIVKNWNINYIRIALVLPCIAMKHYVNFFLGLDTCLLEVKPIQHFFFEIVTLMGLIYIFGFISFSIVRICCPLFYVKMIKIIYK